MTQDEGNIKFHLKWRQATTLPREITREIARYRNLCFQKKYIGINEGVGYGNISARCRNGRRFLISGTQTGGLKRMSARHFTLVLRVDFKSNSVTCMGPVKASAESLTHAMFYRLDKKINCVIHIHHRALWRKLKDRVPTTAATARYGTIGMCRAVERLYRSSNLKEIKIMVMAGHQDGIISFGNNAEEAMRVLDEYVASLLYPGKSPDGK